MFEFWPFLDLINGWIPLGHLIGLGRYIVTIELSG